VPDRPIQHRILELVEQIVASMNSVGTTELTAFDRHIGARVRSRRLELRLSESSTAEVLRCTIDQLRAYEEGRAHISAVLLFELSRVLSVEVNYFFLGVPAHAKLGRADEAID
jgi:DNA-binding transcriptional regulator YiaG